MILIYITIHYNRNGPASTYNYTGLAHGASEGKLTSDLERQKHPRLGQQNNI